MSLLCFTETRDELTLMEEPVTETTAKEDCTHHDSDSNENGQLPYDVSSDLTCTAGDDQTIDQASYQTNNSRTDQTSDHTNGFDSGLNRDTSSDLSSDPINFRTSGQTSGPIRELASGLTCHLSTHTPVCSAEKTSPEPSPIDINCLIQDSLHTATSRIDDREQSSERTTQRIKTLIKLLGMGCHVDQGMRYNKIKI